MGHRHRGHPRRARPSPRIPTSSWPGCGCTPTTRPGVTPARSAAASRSGSSPPRTPTPCCSTPTPTASATRPTPTCAPTAWSTTSAGCWPPGNNVVNTSFVPLLYPAAAGAGVLDRLQAACLEGGTSFYTSGIDPGFGNAGITIRALALCKEVQTVRMMEIVNYATWDNPFTMFEIMGFGKPDTSTSLLLAPGSTTLAWGPVVDAGGRRARRRARRDRGVARGHPRRRGFEIASGPIPKGGISGMRFEIRGHGRRRGPHRRRARHPPARRATRPTGRRARATASWSRASRA